MTTKRIFCLACSITLLASTLLTSCSDDEYEESPQKELVPQKIAIYYEDHVFQQKWQYEAVRIGEYYWMNSNFYHYIENPVTQAQIDKCLTNLRINPKEYQVNIDDFNRYFGGYYSRGYIEHMFGNGFVYEGEEKVLNRGWNLPYSEDFQQLFAMCGDGTEPYVRTALSCKPGDNPIAKLSYWFGSLNTNKYGFNLTPGGARFHAGDRWGTCFGNNDCPTFEADPGDFYGLLMMARWAGNASKTITIHDYPDPNEGKLFHLLNVRWCRKLTDDELGYKLYINKAQTDIIKRNPIQQAPAGYTELPKGYLRGFYVQYILDNPQPVKTVAELVQMTKGLR